MKIIMVSVLDDDRRTFDRIAKEMRFASRNKGEGWIDLNKESPEHLGAIREEYVAGELSFLRSSNIPEGVKYSVLRTYPNVNRIPRNGYLKEGIMYQSGLVEDKRSGRDRSTLHIVGNETQILPHALDQFLEDRVLVGPQAQDVNLVLSQYLRWMIQKHNYTSGSAPLFVNEIR